MTTTRKVEKKEKVKPCKICGATNNGWHASKRPLKPKPKKTKVHEHLWEYMGNFINDEGEWNFRRFFCKFCLEIRKI